MNDVRSKRRVLRLLGLVTSLLVFAGTSVTAMAASIGFAPDALSVTQGASTQVDIAFSDLAGEVVSAYDLDVLYDASVLNATGVMFASALGDEVLFEVFNGYDVSSPGVVDLAQLSLLFDFELAARQSGDRVVVATLLFDAVGAGNSALEFVLDDFNDVKGFGGLVLDVTPDSGSIRVEAAVPEPQAALLFALGAVLLRPALRRRSRLPVG